MKKTIITIAIILLLVGCSKEEPLPVPVQQCDYTPFITQQNTLIASNTVCTTKLGTLQSDNNNLKLQIMNMNVSTQTTVSKSSSDCTTVVRMLNSCEVRLEDCWINSNQTIEYINRTYDNSTLRYMYEDCIETLTEINESLN